MRNLIFILILFVVTSIGYSGDLTLLDDVAGDYAVMEYDFVPAQGSLHIVATESAVGYRLHPSDSNQPFPTTELLTENSNADIFVDSGTTIIDYHEGEKHVNIAIEPGSPMYVATTICIGTTSCQYYTVTIE